MRKDTPAKTCAALDLPKGLDVKRSLFLLLTAVSEGLTGLLLLLLPSVPLSLLLGLSGPEQDVLLVSRVAGTALIAIAVTSGMARADAGSPALRAILSGILIYDLAVAAVLAYGGIGLHMNGILLWPAVLAHLALAAWCFLCLWPIRPSNAGSRKSHQ